MGGGHLEFVFGCQYRRHEHHDEEVHETLRDTVHVMILSFLLLSARLGLASSYLDFLPFLRNTFHLNAASLLRAVHGSIIPFPLTFYGHLPSHMHCFNVVLSPPIAQPGFPFISVSA